ncbi:hypothetical protein CEXT_627861 [Caerostris extrusa]|uniref:Uncharacterized protein n=1 Tax=Caerostris extrusa TaxID=172846 RepID=A0AAV4XCP9_CAEEX|nr:hypothetical protein CEXT_627861 [Caerostris extrusa]
MKPILKLTLVWLLAVISFERTMSAILAQEEKSMMPSEFQDSSDDGTLKMPDVLPPISTGIQRNQSRQPSELQRKRATYSKQCSSMPCRASKIMSPLIQIFSHF